MPPISKLEQMNRSGKDLSELVKLWRSFKTGSKQEARLLRDLNCGFKTAYRVLGPKTNTRRKPMIPTICTGKASCNGAGDYTKRRENELAAARSIWNARIAERKAAEKASQNVYKGEMYPEGAPLRAVGL